MAVAAAVVVVVLVAAAALRRADPPSKVMIARNRPGTAQNAGSAANVANVKESAANAKANAVGAPPVHANKRHNSHKSPLAKAWPTGFFTWLV